MKTGYDLGFLVKNDEKKPSSRKEWKIFGRILLFLQGTPLYLREKGAKIY